MSYFNRGRAKVLGELVEDTIDKEKVRQKRIKPRAKLSDIQARYKSYNINKRDDRRIS
jgi:hypothetical protein